MICNVVLRKRNKFYNSSKFFKRFDSVTCAICRKDLKDSSSYYCDECEKDVKKKTRKRFSRN